MIAFVRLTDAVSVAGQMTPDRIAQAAAEGFRAVINNRPDGEEPNQSTEAEVQAAAEAAGLAYRFIPVAQGFSREQVTARAAALAADGPILAFCRSGTRSTNLWALAEASRGADADALIEAAASGGYDISGLRPTLVSLSGT